MSYIYSDVSREDDAYALPNVEVFEVCRGEETEACPEPGWYWAAGFPGCLWDSDPVGPFGSEEEAEEDAQSDC